MRWAQEVVSTRVTQAIPTMRGLCKACPRNIYIYTIASPGAVLLRRHGGRKRAYQKKSPWGKSEITSFSAALPSYVHAQPKLMTKPAPDRDAAREDAGPAPGLVRVSSVADR